MPAPALELFDLDEAFSSERAQITQLANKCLAVIDGGEEEATAVVLNGSGGSGGGGTKAAAIVNEKELEYFIIECGRIMNMVPSTPDKTQPISAKEILYDICLKIAKYKKLDRE